MTDSDTDAREPAELPAEIREKVPDWDDDYLDRVSDRLMYNYDLVRDHSVRGEQFGLYGELRVLNQKRFFHPSLSYADQKTGEHVFARRVDRPTVAELQRLAALGNDLAEEWVEGDEEHFETKFTFVLVAEDVPEDVRSFVDGFRDRTLLKFGYYGHYEVNLVVVAPDEEAAVASEAADVLGAFALWDDVEREPEGFFSRFARRFWN